MAERQENLSLRRLSRKIQFAIFNAFPKLLEFFKISTMDSDVYQYFWNILKNVLHSREANTEKGDDFLTTTVSRSKKRNTENGVDF